MAKPLASLSLDLDNKWSYLKTHGDPGWEEYPSYLDVVVPRVLRMLDKLDLRITFFIVGQDAARPENQRALRSIADAGHEIGNHSYNHEPWLHLYQPDEIEYELQRTEDALEAATGLRPNVFRGPGYSCSPDLLRKLSERGYQFDASKLPTFIGPLARAHYLFRSNLGKQERTKRKRLFGSLKEGFCSLKPFLWQVDGPGQEKQKLLEIPVTTMPLFRLPFHFSYLHYLCQFSTKLAWFYWKLSISLCRITGVQPSLLLHPLDFMDASDEPELDFFPGMRISTAKKCEFLEATLRDFSRAYEVLPMTEHADKLLQVKKLKLKSLPPVPEEQPPQDLTTSRTSTSQPNQAETLTSASV